MAEALDASGSQVVGCSCGLWKGINLDGLVRNNSLAAVYCEFLMS